jgi:hypothetical protein
MSPRGDHLAHLKGMARDYHYQFHFEIGGSKNLSIVIRTRSRLSPSALVYPRFRLHSSKAGAALHLNIRSVL